ncbi:MAG TPA: hypothetical protein VJJ22_04380 [Candidatus Paceibacterota bacterium]
MKNIIIAVVITIIIAGGGGYAYGKGATNSGSDDAKLQDAVGMMKEQSISIKQMAEMMKASGLNMQELGAKYKDDMMISEGKDLQMIGEKYMREDAESTDSNAEMNKMME